MFCPKTYAHFASYASQVSSPITHNQVVHDLDIFISGSIFGATRPSIILNTLSPLLNSAALCFHYVIRRRPLSKDFHEVLMKLLGRHSSLTEVLDNHSDLKFLYFANVSHPPLLKSALHKQPSMTASFSHFNALHIWIKWPTGKDFNSINLTEAYRAENLLIAPRLVHCLVFSSWLAIKHAIS